MVPSIQPKIQPRRTQRQVPSRSVESPRPCLPLDTAEAVRRYYDEWGVRMLSKVPRIDEKWLATEVRFGHTQSSFVSYRTFGDILRAKGRAAAAVELLLSLRLPRAGRRPLIYYGCVCEFLNGLIYNTLPEEEEKSHRPPFGALLTPRALELIKLFQAAECYPSPRQSKDLVKS